MADVEEPQFTSLKDRIAALNKQKNFSSTDSAPSPVRPQKRPPPPAPPGRPIANGRSQTAPAVPVNSPAPSQASLPTRPAKANPPPLPHRDTQTSLGDGPVGTPPPLPSRTPSYQLSPGLQARRPSTQSNYLSARRNSGSSEISVMSNLSQTQTISSTTSQGSNGTAKFKLPPAFDHLSMPALPQTKREKAAEVQEESDRMAGIARKSLAASRSASSKSIPTVQQIGPKPRPVYNRSTPSIPQVPQMPQVPQYEPAPQPKAPSLPPRLPARRAGPLKSQPSEQSVLESNGVEKAPPKPPRPTLGAIRGFGDTSRPRVPSASSRPHEGEPPRDEPRDAAPPIPMSSRPSMAQIQSATAVAAVNAPPAPAHDCWVCRDWSGPDNVAAQFPKESLPRNDPVGHLAHGLCSPFPSYTDKARAIFTWFHHNIFYDTKAFFSKNLQHRSVEETIFYGWAVCEGYAKVYEAIAKRAGLDCVIVVGHGKGFGHTPLQPGERPPPAKPDGHAWNAVRIDGGHWKLLDACWGAGHICGANNLYKQEFSPREFIMSNEKIGERHFPQNPKYQFREDGRTLSWDEYFIGRPGERPTVYTNAKQEGISEDSIEPSQKSISVYSGESVRFQFSKICEHWTSEEFGLGKPPLLLLSIHGVDGRNDDMIPIETDGYWHWVDVDARKLGAPGQSVQVAQLTSINGNDARGVSAKEFLSKKGKPGGMGWSYMMKWELV